MALAPGTRLGPYIVESQLGAGGMGEVYRAKDSRLERTVAIKVLPTLWADNLEMRQRFEREAQVIASLNHPHICVLHDIGRHQDTDFLVMEYLDGETLAQRIERGALPIDEALKVAIAIADALDKAHRQGVTHRDLKPSNIFLARRSGSSEPPLAKLLDFGLAKFGAAGAGKAGTAGEGGGFSATPTDRNLTAQGAIIGTLQYMAPEQLEGIEADPRTDIFAFGAVLHEMVTGRKAFEGKSRVLLMSAIATGEPPPLSTLLQSGVISQPERAAGAHDAASPVSLVWLDHVVKTCLAKDPTDRWQDARDLLAELQWIAEGSAETDMTAPVAPQSQKREKLLLASLVVAALLVAAMATPAVRYFRGPGEPEEFRFRVPLVTSVQPVTGNPNPSAAGDVAVSPDGRAIVYMTQIGLGDPLSMFVRPMDAVTPQRLTGAENAAQPFWSADSRSIAFVAVGRLKRVQASGGPPQDICEATDFTGGTWNADGTIVFGTAQGLYRVSAQGGKPSAITTLDQSETGHFWPHFLPDGRHYLYLAWSGQANNRAIFAGVLDSKEKARIMGAESKAVYTSPGYLLFRRENTVYAQPFDVKKLTVSGEPVRVADQVTWGANGQGSFGVSRQGDLLYYYGSNTGANTTDVLEWQLAWVNRMGQQLEAVGPPAVYRGAEASPDGKRVAVHRHDSTGGDIFVIEPKGALTRLTFDASRHNSSPIWSPDGSRIVYSSLQKGKWGLYQTRSDGSGTEELLVESDLPKAPMSWAPDGKRLVYWVQDPKAAGDLWVLPLDGDKKPAPLVASTFNETHGQIAPDGKWIAYVSNSTGRGEIHVQPFPSGSGRWQVSTGGGDWPRWRRDGKELFFHDVGLPPAPGILNGPILSAQVSATGATFQAGSPKDVVGINALTFAHSGGEYQTYDVSADGQRFLIFEVVPPAAATGDQVGPEPNTGLIVARHWASAIRK